MTLYPGLVNNTSARFVPPPTTPTGPTIIANVTNGQVVSLFNQTCVQPTFSALYSQLGDRAFILSMAGNDSNGSVEIFFGFHWTSSCTNYTQFKSCSFEEAWVGFPATNQVSGPELSEWPATSSGGANESDSDLVLVGVAGAVVAATVGVVLALHIRGRKG